MYVGLCVKWLLISSVLTTFYFPGQILLNKIPDIQFHDNPSIGKFYLLAIFMRTRLSILGDGGLRGLERQFGVLL